MGEVLLYLDSIHRQKCLSNTARRKYGRKGSNFRIDANDLAKIGRGGDIPQVGEYTVRVRGYVHTHRYLQHREVSGSAWVTECLGFGWGRRPTCSNERGRSSQAHDTAATRQCEYSPAVLRRHGRATSTTASPAL